MLSVGSTDIRVHLGRSGTRIAPPEETGMQHHHLGASPETVHWGWFDAAQEPVLSIDSGDRITVQSVSGGPGNLPGDGFHVPPELYRIHEQVERKLPGHILTGPIAVRGAVPGDVLGHRIVDVRVRPGCGLLFVRPLSCVNPEVGEEDVRRGRKGW